MHKVRAKSHIQLGISGEKVEIDPLGGSGGLPWPRLARPVSHQMDTVASCDLGDLRSSGSSARASFRIVYRLPMVAPGDTPAFKHYDFECDFNTAEEIVQKVNLILELRSSSSRKEYLAHKDRKTHKQRRSFYKL